MKEIAKEEDKRYVPFQITSEMFRGEESLPDWIYEDYFICFDPVNRLGVILNKTYDPIGYDLYVSIDNPVQCYFHQYYWIGMLKDGSGVASFSPRLWAIKYGQVGEEPLYTLTNK